MATGSRRGGASAKRRSGAYRGSSKKSSTGRQGKSGQGSDAVIDEVALLIVLAVSVLLFLSDLKLIGSFGKTVSGIMFGLFGIPAFVVPFILFFAGAFLISNKGMNVAGARTGAYVVLIFMLCSFAHMFTMGKYGDTPLKDFYAICSEERTGGGFFGAMIALALTKTIGKAGAYIVLIVLTIICGVIITERSFLNGIKMGSKSIYDKSREGAKRHHAVRAVRQEELSKERAIRNRERAIRREELREERLEAVREREEALEERRRKRSEMKVSGVMLDTRIVDDSAVSETVDVEKELAAYAKSEVARALAEEVPEEVVAAVAGTAVASDDMHELSVEAIRDIEEARHIEDIRDIKRAESKREYRMEERDAVNFKSAHHISFENELKEAPVLVDEVVIKTAEEKIVPIRKEMSGIADGEMPSVRGPIAELTFDQKEAPKEEEALDDGEDFDIFALLKEMDPSTEMRTEPAAHETAEVKAEVQAEPVREPEPAKEEPKEELKPEAPVAVEEPKKQAPREYAFPTLDLLDPPKARNNGDSMEALRGTAAKLKETLATFGVNVTMTEISQGPTVTRFEMQPETDVKVSKILSLSDDIKLNMAATDVRIEAPIPGKAAIGIEIPNKEPIPVNFQELVSDEAFQNASSNVSFAVGKDIEGKVVVTDIAKMPHLLIAGATGSGKSVCINTLIMSILYKADPEDVKLIMIDPKVVELSVYNGIPHLMIPVVTDPKKAAAALQWGVAEMDDRYNKFAEYKVRDMKGFNKLVTSSDFNDIPENERPKKMPQIVIIVDELADLMMVASKEVEESICRIAQKARAAGIHLVVATQRPSVDVITGLIKANMPSRIAFSVSSGTDSRTILDMVGAEKLLGKGDMLFYPQGYSKPARLQGAFISDDEVTRVVDALKAQTEGTSYDNDVISRMNSVATEGSSSGAAGLTLGSDNNGKDELFEKAARFIIEKDKASIGMLQRAFKIGFNRAARIMDQLADEGVVGEEEGTKPRKILMSEEQFEQYVEETL